MLHSIVALNAVRPEYTERSARLTTVPRQGTETHLESMKLTPKPQTLKALNPTTLNPKNRRSPDRDVRGPGLV